MKKVKGVYQEISGGFIHLFSDNTLYTIPVNDNDNWACVTVGDITASGFPLTQEKFDQWKSECDREGTFELPEEEDIQYPYDDSDKSSE